MRVILVGMAVSIAWLGCGRHEPLPGERTSVAAVGSEQVNAGMPPVAGPAVISGPQAVDQQIENGARLYWGTAAADHGEEVVVFLLAPDGSGALYSPPGLVPLCITRSSGDSISWESGRSFGLRYSFTGQLTPVGMSGTLRPVRTRRGPDLPPVHVDFARIEPQAAEHPWSGVFSDVVFVEEAGDLVGVEVLLLHLSGQIQGAVTFYEGGPGSPLSFGRPNVNGDTISFALTGSGDLGPGGYMLVHRGGQVELIATGQAAQTDTLPRKQSIMEFMSRVVEPRCV